MSQWSVCLMQFFIRLICHFIDKSGKNYLYCLILILTNCTKINEKSHNHMSLSKSWIEQSISINHLFLLHCSWFYFKLTIIVHNMVFIFFLKKRGNRYTHEKKFHKTNLYYTLFLLSVVLLSSSNTFVMSKQYHTTKWATVFWTDFLSYCVYTHNIWKHDKSSSHIKTLRCARFVARASFKIQKRQTPDSRKNEEPLFPVIIVTRSVGHFKKSVYTL